METQKTTITLTAEEVQAIRTACDKAKKNPMWSFEVKVEGWGRWFNIHWDPRYNWFEAVRLWEGWANKHYFYKKTPEELVSAISADIASDPA